MKSKTKTSTPTPKRDRSGWISLDLGGPLKRILTTIAAKDRLPYETEVNVTRTLRRLILDEAGRRGIKLT